MRQVLVPKDLPPAIALAHRPEPVVLLGGETMGTTWAVRFVKPDHADGHAVRALIERVLDGVIASMSTWEPASAISAFNRAPPGTWHELDGDFAHVLGTALAVAEDTGGAYDPTIGTLVNLWGFGPAGPRTDVPSQDGIDGALMRSGWRRIARQGGTHFMQPGGVEIDLSSIAKGFAVDAVSQALLRYGFRNHLVEIGGELRGSGVKPDGSPWWVAIESAGPPEIVAALCGLSVATSGDSQRRFESGGRTYSHTIDPRTGNPIEHGIASVSVFHASCMQADVLATALTVLGLERGMAYATQREIAVLFTVSTAVGATRYASPAYDAMLV